MKTLREYIEWAKEKGVAIGHFNVSDSEGFKAVVEAAQELGVPVIIGVSEKEELSRRGRDPRAGYCRAKQRHAGLFER